MPTQPKRPCSVAGCAGFAIKFGRCEKHSQEIQRYQDSQRESPSKRGYGRDWKILREQHLRQHPYCVKCQATHGLEVDHIIPHKGNYKLLFDINNLQTLCHRCHSRKTAKEVNEVHALGVEFGFKWGWEAIPVLPTVPALMP